MKKFDNRAWSLMIPAGSIMAMVGIIPLIAVFNYSFHDLFSLQHPFWVGVDWYRAIMTSDRFYASLARSLVFSALVLSVQVPLGIAIALLIPKTGLMRNLVLILVALPLVVPWNIIPIMWLNLIDIEKGLAGRALIWLGTGFDYKFHALHTWLVLIAMDTWHWLGLVVVLAYAGLSGIAPAYYQAAAVDGASAYQVFRHIQLPKMSSVLPMVLLLRFVDSFMIYTEAFRINAGGPNNATMFLSLDLGEEINSFNYGPAAARAMVYFLLVLTVAWAFKTIVERQKAHPAVQP